MIKLCIFDLDGTVLDTIETIAYYGNYALQKNNIEPIAVCEYKYLAGNGIAKLIKNMLQFRNCFTEELYNKVFHDYDTAYNADATYKTSIFEGLKDVLDQMKDMGIKLAIVSNKPDYPTKKVVSSLYGEDYFTCVLGQREGKALKPDPTAVFDVISDLNVSKEDCIYIGDTSVDMKTGKNAGLFTIGVLWGFRDKKELLENGADMVIKKPSELYEFVLINNM